MSGEKEARMVPFRETDFGRGRAILKGNMICLWNSQAKPEGI